MNSPEIEQFLTYLAVERNVAASTQNQALAALLFLYQQVLRQPLDYPIDAVRAKKPARLPVVLSQAEVNRLLAHLPDHHQLIARLLYGSGLRLREGLRLRVKDIDFDQHQIIVRSGKGHKDRDTLLPDSLVAPLQRQLRYAKTLHQNDLERGYGQVYLPHALARKYPNASQEWGWNMSFLPINSLKTRGAVWFAVTTSTPPACKKRSGLLPKPPISTNRWAVIPCATLLPPTCWNQVMIFERFRNYRVMRMYPLP